jgi:MbtH protein
MSEHEKTAPEDEPQFKVVINHEDQYSIWPGDRESPAGWRDVGVCGPKSHCLSYIDANWTDMRPRSLRERLAQLNGSAAEN